MHLYFFVSFIIGILLGAKGVLSLSWLTLILMILFLPLGFFARRNNQRPFFVSLIFFFVFLGALWVTSQANSSRQDFFKGKSEFTIKVISSPQSYSLGRKFYARIEESRGYRLNLQVRVNDFSLSQVNYGDTFRVQGKLTRRKYKESYFYALWLKDGSYIRKLPVGFVDGMVSFFHEKVIIYAEKYLSQDAWRFLAAVFLGRREFAPKEMKEVFIEAAVAHLFAISGLHVGLLSLFLLFILKIIRVKFRPRLILTLFFVSIYAVLAGYRASILRASLMYAIFAVSFFLKRKVNLSVPFSTAGIICLLLNPLWLFDLGFQLSFLSVGSLIAGFSLFKLNFVSTNRFFTYVKGIFFSTVFVTVATVPLISFYFGRINLLGIISNIILIPLFTLNLILIAVFLGVYFLPFLPIIIGDALSFSLFIFMNIAGRLARVKFSFIAFSFPLYAVIIYYFCLVFICSFVVLRRKKLKV
ncbi:MAG: ComEC/Rec2 family competence protein [Candidatus Omnitrophota bacterium]